VTTVLLQTSAQGDVRMDIAFSNGSGDQLPAGSQIAVYLDTDRNPHTGSPQGAEFLILLNPAALTYSSFRWDGQTFVFKHLPTLHANTAYLQSWWINSTDLENTTGFFFWIKTYAAGQAPGDNAPNIGSTDSSISPPGTWFWPTTPDYTTPTPNPPPPPSSPPTGSDVPRAEIRPIGVPHAGKPYDVAADFVVDKGRVVSPDTLRCSATVGRTPLRTTIIARGNTKNCHVPTLPPTAKGKTLTITLLATLADTARVRKTIRLLIRG